MPNAPEEFNRTVTSAESAPTDAKAGMYCATKNLAVVTVDTLTTMVSYTVSFYELPDAVTDGSSGYGDDNWQVTSSKSRDRACVFRIRLEGSQSFAAKVTFLDGTSVRINTKLM